MRSSFIGPMPSVVRELSIENAMKIFQYNLPILVLFRNTSAEDAFYYDKELAGAYALVQDQILVTIADINNGIS